LKICYLISEGRVDPEYIYTRTRVSRGVGHKFDGAG
jgi:hypothetical protein